MPKVTGNDLVVQTLKNEGVDTVFFLTGGPMSDVAGLCLEMELKSIDVRHEQGAAMMAHAFSRLSGKPGICFAASGPGTTNLLTGIGNSYLDATPVVALGGSSPITETGRGAFQEMDQLSIFKPVTKWAERATDAKRSGVGEQSGAHGLTGAARPGLSRLARRYPLHRGGTGRGALPAQPE